MLPMCNIQHERVKDKSQTKNLLVKYYQIKRSRNCINKFELHVVAQPLDTDSLTKFYHVRESTCYRLVLKKLLVVLERLVPEVFGWM